MLTRTRDHAVANDHRRVDASRGFTLIELLVTIAVAAVVATVAVPSFNELARSLRVSTTVNTFLSSIHFARSEAMRRGTRVAVCPSPDQQQCDAGADFDDGWLVVAGTNPYAASAPVLRSFTPDTGSIDIRLHFGNNAPNHLSYVPTGQARRASGGMLMGSVRFCHDGDDRRIIVNATGRPRVAQESCEA